MSYNHEALPRYVRTAGKITIVTAISGLLVFLVAFMFDVGTQELNKVSAQSASTTLTVINLPPEFDVVPHEDPGSSTTTPTNSGDAITWRAQATDGNGAPWFLLICSNNATPTANNAAGLGSLGTEPPDCDGSATQWGVSASTTSGGWATVSAVTTEVAPYGEINNWYGWACDDDPLFPACTAVPEQGFNATNTSPFNVNKRPLLEGFSNSGATDPGSAITFYSTSSDPDIGYDNNIFLVVCSTNGDYDANLNTCPNDLIASSTSYATDNATSSYSIPIPTRDQFYEAYAYIVDEFGHEATTSAVQVDFEVANVAPYVMSPSIVLNGGSNINSLIPGTESIPASTTLAFTINDDNSCLNAASGDEITDFDVVVFRSDIGTTTCSGDGTGYDPNNCYDSGVATTTWNLSCTADAACPNATTTDMSYSCTFPLWFLADPTDNGVNVPTSLSDTSWSAAVAGKDEALTGNMATSTGVVEMISQPAIDVMAYAIAYGNVAPGDDTQGVNASSTIINIGNTGVDQNTQGEHMCGDFAIGNECPNLATSTIPEVQQQFASTTFTYEVGGPVTPGIFELSSSTNQEVELDVVKTVATSSSSWAEGTTYWGIQVPASISLSGSYKGLNYFQFVVSEDDEWGAGY